jgi:carbon-monoxide dehydrogenase large subunit
VTVEDCGTVLNPLILDGQIHGGVALGIGNSFYEQLIYDENGQLLNASLADYLIPSSTEIPRMELGHEETLSPLNPIGSKGAGEAGTIPVPALFAQALEDALQDYGVEILEMPMSPNKLFELVYRQTE